MYSTPLRSCSFKKNTRAFTLFEAIMSLVIFSFMSLTMSALYVQNQRFARQQTNSVQVVNTTFSILDQVKNLGADQIWQAYKTPTNTFSVNYVDPTDAVDGYRVLTLKVNKIDNTEVNPIWTTANLTLAAQPGSTTVIPVKYWLTIRRNLMKTGTVTNCDVLEVTLVYQWQVGGSKTKYVGQLQLTFPAPNGTYK